MTKEVILEVLTELFISFFDEDLIKLKRDTTSEDIEDWDSLAQVGIILSIEKKFGIKLNSLEVGKLENIGAMIDLIYEKKS
jgi:acyl carrier protein